MARHAGTCALTGQDAHRASRPRVRLPRLHDPAVPIAADQNRPQSTHHTEQSVHPGNTDQPGRRLEALRRRARARGHPCAQSRHPGLGTLLPDWYCVQGLQQPGQLDVPQSRALGKSYPSPQIQRLAQSPLLGSLPPDQSRCVGLRRPGQRCLPPKVQMVQDRATYHRARHGIAGRPDVTDVLDSSAAGEGTLPTAEIANGSPRGKVGSARFVEIRCSMTKSCTSTTSNHKPTEEPTRTPTWNSCIISVINNAMCTHPCPNGQPRRVVRLRDLLEPYAL